VGEQGAGRADIPDCAHRDSTPSRQILEAAQIAEYAQRCSRVGSGRACAPIVRLCVPESLDSATSSRQKSATGVARYRPGERETIGPVATRALTKDSVEMQFLTDDPVAQAVTYQRATFDARAPRCGRCVCATAWRVSWT